MNFSFRDLQGIKSEVSCDSGPLCVLTVSQVLTIGWDGGLRPSSFLFAEECPQQAEDSLSCLYLCLLPFRGQGLSLRIGRDIGAHSFMSSSAVGPVETVSLPQFLQDHSFFFFILGFF